MRTQQGFWEGDSERYLREDGRQLTCGGSSSNVKPFVHKAEALEMRVVEAGGSRSTLPSNGKGPKS